MSRQTVMKIRIDAALPTDPADLGAVTANAQKIEELKKHLAENGFTLTGEVSAKLGTVNSEEPEKQDAEQAA